MAWEERGKRKYLYRSRWENGRVVREYLGNEEKAEASAKRDEAERAQRAELKRIGVILDALRIVIDVLIEERMIAAGYHRHDRGPWRKNVSHPEVTDPLVTPEASAEGTLLTLLKRVNDGDKNALAHLRAFLASTRGAAPCLGGDLALYANALLVQCFAGNDKVLREALAQELKNLRSELCGGNDSPTGIERLVIEDVVTNWLHFHRLQCLYAGQEGATFVKNGFYEKQLTAAHNRYVASMRTLIDARRRPLPNIQINVADKQVNVAGNVTANVPPPNETPASLG